MIMRTILFISVFPALLNAHGYLSSPPPRGIQKEQYQVDDLKAPNAKGVCRGEPEGKVTKVTPGGSLTLGFTITAPHTGPCELYLLSYPGLQQEKLIASKYDCVAPGKVAPWTVTLPTANGRKVLRWYWEGRHISTPGEPYEQCVDVEFGGGGGSEGGKYPAPSPNMPPPNKQQQNANDDEDLVVKKKGAEPSPRPRPPAAAPANPYKAPPAYNGGGGGGGDGSGGCTSGYQRCQGQGFQICDNRHWVPMSCPPGTRCNQNGNSIICGY